MARTKNKNKHIYSTKHAEQPSLRTLIKNSKFTSLENYVHPLLPRPCQNVIKVLRDIQPFLENNSDPTVYLAV